LSYVTASQVQRNKKKTQTHGHTGKVIAALDYLGTKYETKKVDYCQSRLPLIVATPF